MTSRMQEHNGEIRLTIRVEHFSQTDLDALVDRINEDAYVSDIQVVRPESRHCDHCDLDVPWAPYCTNCGRELDS